ncbi:MAG TPA: hypothetical protein VKE74_30310 [Gemmataceae bacterium]|nr:hypothetical protein [Gemmataceae bacterium]
MRKLALACAALALAALTGCGTPATSTFHGTVSYRGQPVKSGVIYFLGPAPQMRMGMGTIHDDGTYTATDVPVGEVRVSFQAPGLPERYADPNTSNLAYRITSGMSSLDITIPVESSGKRGAG